VSETDVSSTQDPGQRSKFFKPEERGIELIPPAEQKMKPIPLFWLWPGAIFTVEFLVYGALIVSFGLSFGQALVVILLGNLAYFAVGVMSIQGAITGTTAMMVGRGVFGRRGNHVPSFFNWITQDGYEVLGLVLVVLLVSSMFTRSGVDVHNGLKLGILAVAVVVQFILPFLGRAVIEKTLRYLSYIFYLYCGLHGNSFSDHPSRRSRQNASVCFVAAHDFGFGSNRVCGRSGMDQECERLFPVYSKHNL
jgi:purine-cytosine permease-like protein